jgi:hypothetical protein
MMFDYRTELPEDFDDNSKVWIYQSSRLFTLSEVLQIQELLQDFVTSWNSHGVPVKGYANLFYGQFIVLMADEKASRVSGCSTDSSVHLVKKIESLFHTGMFDRQLLAFFIKEKVQLLPMGQLDYAAKSGILPPDTLYFDNTVLTKADLISRWVVPLQNSWLARKLHFPKLA